MVNVSESPYKVERRLARRKETAEAWSDYHINEAMYRLVREHGLSVLALVEIKDSLAEGSAASALIEMKTR
jgi:hypothetical protein